MPAFSLLPAPAVLTVDLQRWQNAPLPPQPPAGDRGPWLRYWA